MQPERAMPERTVGDGRGRIERIIGGSVPGVLLRLAVLSLVTGVVMSVLGIHPGDIVAWIEGRIAWLATLSLDTVRAGAGYCLMGAAVVVPVWIVWRIFRVTRL